MTIWQIIIVVCLYLIVGGVINAVLGGDDDSALIFVALWPCILIPIIIVCVLSIFGSFGQLIVKSIRNVIDAFKRLFRKEEK